MSVAKASIVNMIKLVPDDIQDEILAIICYTIYTNRWGHMAMRFLRVSRKEAEKITHDINSDWHKRFQGEEYCVIHSHSYTPDSPGYDYYFINHGFNDYEFLGKRLTKARR